MATNQCAHTVRKSMAMGPSVRNLLSHYQLDAKNIASTGPYQTLLKSDVLAYVSQHKLQPVKPGQSPSGRVQEKGGVRVFVPNLDLSGYQPEAGQLSKIAKELLNK